MIESSQVCRSCLREGGFMMNLFTIHGELEEFRLDVMLMSSTQVQVTEDDGFPGQICLDCAERLMNAFTFKLMCQQSNSKLMEKFGNSSNDFNEQSGDYCGVDSEDTKLGYEVTRVKVEKTDVVEPRTMVLYNRNMRRDKSGDACICNEKCTQTSAGSFMELFNCSECQKKFSSFIGLSRHLLKHGLIDPVHWSSFNEDFTHDSFQNKNESPSGRPYSCAVCRETFVHRDLFEKHKKSHSKGSKLECSKCGVVFSSTLACDSHSCGSKFPLPGNLVVHTKEMHGEVDSKETKADGEVYVDHLWDSGDGVSAKVEPLEDILEDTDREYEMMPADDSDVSHRGYLTYQDLEPTSTQTERTKKSLKCGACKMVFASMSELSEHQCQEHTEENIKHNGPHVCDICNNSYGDEDTLRKHQMSHDTKPKLFECEMCDKTFDKAYLLNQHKWKHVSVKPYQCDVCQRGFIREQQLEKHKVALHSGKEKKPQVAFCEICSRGFTTSKYLEEHHMQIHATNEQDRRFSCPTCSKAFTTKCHLKRHIKTHTNEKTYLCPECGTGFASNSHLVVHMRRHRGEKPYQCKFCGKRFTRRGDLGVHERYHTGEVTHKCQDCGKGFQRKCSLKIHQRVHTGEKPYACTYCERKFAQANDLKAHVRRHTGERDNCELCGEGFLMLYHLTRHKRTVHGLDCSSNIKRVEKIPQEPKNDSSTSSSNGKSNPK